MEVNEPAIAYGKQKISIEEYLEMENAALEKHEYYKGEVFAMSGAKPPHNTIFKNLLTGLGVKLKEKKCQPYGSDMRVHITSNTLFTYPDISIACGEVITLNNDDYNVLNPTVIMKYIHANIISDCSQYQNRKPTLKSDSGKELFKYI